MPDDAAPPVPVESVKFFRNLRSLTPTRLAYISCSCEEEVAQCALDCMADEEAARVEICRVLLNPPILADSARSIGSIEQSAHRRSGTMSSAPPTSGERDPRRPPQSRSRRVE